MEENTPEIVDDVIDKKLEKLLLKHRSELAKIEDKKKNKLIHQAKAWSKSSFKKQEANLKKEEKILKYALENEITKKQAIKALKPKITDRMKEAMGLTADQKIFSKDGLGSVKTGVKNVAGNVKPKIGNMISKGISGGLHTLGAATGNPLLNMAGDAIAKRRERINDARDKQNRAANQKGGFSFDDDDDDDDDYGFGKSKSLSNSTQGIPLSNNVVEVLEEISEGVDLTVEELDDLKSFFLDNFLNEGGMKDITQDQLMLEYKPEEPFEDDQAETKVAQVERQKALDVSQNEVDAEYILEESDDELSALDDIKKENVEMNQTLKKLLLVDVEAKENDILEGAEFDSNDAAPQMNKEEKEDKGMFSDLTKDILAFKGGLSVVTGILSKLAAIPALKALLALGGVGVAAVAIPTIAKIAGDFLDDKLMDWTLDKSDDDLVEQLDTIRKNTEAQNGWQNEKEAKRQFEIESEIARRGIETEEVTEKRSFFKGGGEVTTLRAKGRVEPKEDAIPKLESTNDNVEKQPETFKDSVDAQIKAREESIGRPLNHSEKEMIRTQERQRRKRDTAEADGTLGKIDMTDRELPGSRSSDRPVTPKAPPTKPVQDIKDRTMSTYENSPAAQQVIHEQTINNNAPTMINTNSTTQNSGGGSSGGGGGSVLTGDQVSHGAKLYGSL